MKRNVLMILVNLVLACGACWGCDVNLVAIMTGENPEDVFGRMVGKLASQTRAVGQSLENQETAKERLRTLMGSWIEFDNRFSQKPPEWAKDDPDWGKKIKEMADIIGGFQKHISDKNQEKIHDLILSLFNKLIAFYERMPMPDLQKKILRVSTGFASMYEAMESKNYGDFKKGGTEVTENLSALKGLLASQSVRILNDVVFQVDQLQKLVKMNPSQFTPIIQTSFNNAENAFKEASKKLREIVVKR